MDKISNLITSLKMGSEARKEMVAIPYSKMSLAIAEALEREGFVAGVAKKGKKIHKTIEIKLAYDDLKLPKVKGVERVSKFSKRIYQGVNDIKPVRNGFGLLILSTTKGIVTNKEARKQNIGGEALFKIW